MKNENKIIELITALISLSKSDKLKWVTLRDYQNNNWNENLKHYIIENNSYHDIYGDDKPYLSETNSYCTEFDDGIIYILHFTYSKGEYYIVAIQRSNSSNIIRLNGRNSLQDLVLRLFLLIENRLDDITEFVESIISESRKI